MLRISVSHPLPLRPHALTTHELQSVVGGCLGEGVQCSKDEECCTSTISLYIYQCDGTGTCQKHRTTLWSAGPGL